MDKDEFIGKLQMTYVGDRNAFNEIVSEYDRLNTNYNKALELLSEYNTPCDIDNFMDDNTDYCEINCSVDDKQFKKCWDKFIEWKLKEEGK